MTQVTQVLSMTKAFRGAFGIHSFSIWNKWINILPIHATRKLFSKEGQKRPGRKGRQCHDYSEL